MFKINELYKRNCVTVYLITLSYIYTTAISVVINPKRNC